MSSKAEIVSRQILKPSSPTPNHLRDFKISLLDQIAPPHYVPIVLFYSASDINAFGANIKMISDKLKTSLSDVLTLYYPFCGKLKGNASVECNDVGVLWIESKIPTNLSDILKKPQADQIKEFLPFDPCNPVGVLDQKEHTVNVGIQLNEFSCGGAGIGVCILHKVADGAAIASFLNAWAATTRGHGNIVAPQMDASLIFPPIDLELEQTRVIACNEKLVTKRFVFNGANLSRLRATLGSFNPTRVEAVTALIWKSAMEAAKASLGECNKTLNASMVCHAVNIFNRMVPPLPEHLFGNLWIYSFSPVVGVNGNGEVELHDLVETVRKTVRQVDANYLSKLQGEGLIEVLESLYKARIEIFEKGTPWYGFSSWTRFGFYEVDFGWGKPTWVTTVSMAIKNMVVLMGTRTGDGIEAWITLAEHDMAEFERSPELLDFASFDC